MSICSVKDNPALARALAVWDALANLETFDVVGGLMELARPVHGLPFEGATIPELIARLELDPVDVVAGRKHLDAAARRARRVGLIFSADILGTTYYTVAPGLARFYEIWDAMTTALPEPQTSALRPWMARVLGSNVRRDILWFLAHASEPHSTEQVYEAIRRGLSYEGESRRVPKAGSAVRDVHTPSQVKAGLEKLAEARLVQRAGGSPLTWIATEYHAVPRRDPAPSLADALNALADAVPLERWSTWLRAFSVAEAHDLARLLPLEVVFRPESETNPYLRVARGLGLVTVAAGEGVEQFTLAIDYQEAMARLDALGRHVAREIYLTPWVNIAEALSAEGRIQVVAAAAADHRPSVQTPISVDRIEELTGMDRSHIGTVLEQLSILGLFRRAGPSTWVIHPDLPALLDLSSTVGVDPSSIIEVDTPRRSFTQEVAAMRARTLT